MTYRAYRKAFAAAISGVVGVLALFIPGVADFMSEQFVMTLASIAATVSVYAVPNDPE